ncbi:MAG: Nif11 family protein [bacterium]|nr:Nif11 family protein [bacterium]
MSRVDLERFTADLEHAPGLSEEFSSLGYDPEAWVQRASAKGYHLTSDEADGLSSSYGELSLEDLDNVAGGWTDPPDGGG